MNTPLPFPPPASWLAVLLLALAVAPGVQAQVNIEKLRSLDVDGLAASLNGDFALLAGNSEAVNVGGGLRFDYRMGKHYAFLIGSARYGESRTRRYQERLFAHLRYTCDLTTRLVGELLGQGERDAFTLLQVRLLAGGGLRIRYFDKDVRDCLNFGSDGEREGFSTQRRTTFEARSSATRRKSGRRWIEKNRAQPRIRNLNSL